MFPRGHIVHCSLISNGMRRRTIIIGLGVIILAVGGWFAYRAKTSTNFHKTFPPVLNAGALPSFVIRFYMLGADIGVISGTREIRGGKEFDTVIYRTSTSREQLSKEYQNYFTDIHWTIINTLNENGIFTISAKNATRQVTATFTDKGTAVEGHVTLFGPIVATPTPAPTPNIDPSKLK